MLTRHISSLPRGQLPKQQSFLGLELYSPIHALGAFVATLFPQFPRAAVAVPEMPSLSSCKMSIITQVLPSELVSAFTIFAPPRLLYAMSHCDIGEAANEDGIIPVLKANNDEPASLLLSFHNYQ